MRNMAISIISMLIAFYVIEALASLFLIHGASNNKRLYLVPWMLERTIQLVFYTILWLFIGLYFFTSPQTIGYSMFAIVFGGISLCKFKILDFYLGYLINFFHFSLQLLLFPMRLFVVRTHAWGWRISAPSRRSKSTAKLWELRNYLR